MASQTQGIQQLLAAEKKAADKVAEARKSKYTFVLYFHDFLKKQLCCRNLKYSFQVSALFSCYS